METEARAKVVVSVWMAEFIQFIAVRVLATVPRSIWKKIDEFNLFLQIDRGKADSAARN